MAREPKKRKAGAAGLACSVGSIDPTSAAGLTVDLAVYRALGVAGVCVTTAVTAQNDRRVIGVSPIAAVFVRRQLEAIWEQSDPTAICIGLVPDSASLRTIRLFLRARTKLPAIVIDPVMTATSGHAFVGARELEELRKLLPLATLVTPNVHEASLLATRAVGNEAEAVEAASAIAQAGCAVLLTGGHLAGRRCTDILVRSGRVRRYGATRLRATLRGSGGILAASIAACLAKGMALDPSIRRARAFVRRAFQSARSIGSGLPQYGATFKRLP